MPLADRLAAAHQMRLRAAGHYRDLGAAPQPDNGDEQRYPSLINTFTKTLRQNNLGEVNRESYESMIRAIQSGRKAEFDAVLRGGNVALKESHGGLHLSVHRRRSMPVRHPRRASVRQCRTGGRDGRAVLAGTHPRRSLRPL